MNYLAVYFVKIFYYHLKKLNNLNMIPLNLVNGFSSNLMLLHAYALCDSYVIKKKKKTNFLLVCVFCVCLLLM